MKKNFGSLKSGGVTQTRVDSDGVSASRFGFKGTEDLGGGLKANSLLENVASRLHMGTKLGVEQQKALRGHALSV